MKVDISFTVEKKEVTKETGEKVFVCYMPEIDCYFGARDEEMIKGKANAFVKSFLKD